MWEALGEQGDVKSHHELSPSPHAQQEPLIPDTLASSFWPWDPLCHPPAPQTIRSGVPAVCRCSDSWLAPCRPPPRGCRRGQSWLLHPIITSSCSRLLGMGGALSAWFPSELRCSCKCLAPRTVPRTPAPSLKHRPGTGMAGAQRGWKQEQRNGSPPVYQCRNEAKTAKPTQS